MAKTKKKRYSGIELLRIISMLLIVAAHLSQRGNWSWNNDNEGYSLNWALMNWIICFGQVGVAIFFCITGYFSYSSKNYNWRRIFTVWRPAIFYSLAFLVLAIVLKMPDAELSFPLNIRIMKSVFPVTMNAYWFVSSYIVLSILMPYLKGFLDSLDFKKIFKLILIMALVSIVPNMISYVFAGISTSIFSFPSAIFYAIVGYSINRFQDKISRIGSVRLVVLSGIGFLLYLACSLAIRFASTRLNYSYLSNAILIDTMCLPCMLSSVPLVVVFSRLKFVSKFINYVASLTFGVYLVHSNVYVVSYIWEQNDFLRTFVASHFSFAHFLLYFSLTVFLVYGLSSVVEAVRKFIVSKTVSLTSKIRSVQDNI